jgi:hypothetical protein
MVASVGGAMMRGDDGGPFNEHEQLSRQDVGIGGPGAAGNAGQNLKVPVQVARGNGEYGLDMVLRSRVQYRAAAEGRLLVRLLEGVEHRRQLVAGVVSIST